MEGTTGRYLTQDCENGKVKEAVGGKSYRCRVPTFGRSFGRYRGLCYW